MAGGVDRWERLAAAKAEEIAKYAICDARYDINTDRITYVRRDTGEEFKTLIHDEIVNEFLSSNGQKPFIFCGT